MEDDVKTREDLPAEIENLRSRLEEAEERFRSVSKKRNNEARKHLKDEKRWAKERNSERARTDEVLRDETIKRQCADKELKETQEQLRHVSSRLLLAEETERKRIARDIHDGIAQHWSTIRFRLENILQHLDEQVAAPLADLLPIIQVGLDESRRVQMDLRPAILDDLGILATIKWLCREFQKAHPGIHVEAKIKIEEDEVPNLMKTVLYRVMQEALHNVAKHSKANLVSITLERKDGTIDFVVRDNGVGFDLNEVVSLKGLERGLGLVGIRERIILSGGTVNIESNVGAGTIIQALWPLS